MDGGNIAPMVSHVSIVSCHCVQPNSATLKSILLNFYEQTKGEDAIYNIVTYYKSKPRNWL